MCGSLILWVLCSAWLCSYVTLCCCCGWWGGNLKLPAAAHRSVSASLGFPLSSFVSGSAFDCLLLELWHQSKEITRAHYPGSGLEEILMDWVLFVDVFLAFGFETVLQLKPQNRAVAHKTHFYQKCSRSVWEQQRDRRAGLEDRERKKWVRPRSLLCVCVCV